jgi:hypothetical protein
VKACGREYSMVSNYEKASTMDMRSDVLYLGVWPDWRVTSGEVL